MTTTVFGTAAQNIFIESFHRVEVDFNPNTGAITAITGVLSSDPIDEILALAREGFADSTGINEGFDVYGDLAVDYSLSTAPVFIDLEKNTQVGGFAQGDTLLVQGDSLSIQTAIAGFVPGMFEITGTAFDDVIRGSDSVGVFETVSPPLDNLFIIFDPGDQVLNGGAGNDILEGRGGADTLNGGDGFDIASYESSPAGVFVRLPGVGADTQTAIASGGDAAGDTFSSIEGLVGSRFSDTLVGNSLDNVLAGGLGSDFLDGRGGNDTVDYSHDHFIDPGGTPDQVIVSLGVNGGSGVGNKFQFRIVGLQLVPVLVGVDTLLNIENVTGTPGNDTITGNEQDNVLDGRGGNDTLSGGLGNDTLIGGDGNDLLIGGFGNDILIGGAGNNTASYDDVHDGGTTLTLEQIVISLGLNGADGSYTRSGFFGALGRGGGMQTVETDVLRGIQNITGSSHSETINGNEQDNVLAGNGGNDVINGGAGNDTYDVRGPSGNYRIFDTSGTDKLLVDSLDPSRFSASRDGNDLVILLSNANGAVITTVRVVNHFNGNPVESAVTADGSSLILATGNTGGNGSGVIAAGNGGETLDGRGGDDRLFGGNGSDRIIGGTGDDWLTGGNGADTFVFGPGFGHDVITDFSPADRLEFDGGVFATFQGVQAASAQVGNDTVITLDANNSITLLNVMADSIHAKAVKFA